MSEVIGVIRFTNKLFYLVSFYQLANLLKSTSSIKLKKNNSFKEWLFLSFQTVLLSESILSNGGVKRDRTADLLRARQALSQLSYSPKSQNNLSVASQLIRGLTGMVGLGRFELQTSPLSGVRSNQLSHRPERSQ